MSLGWVRSGWVRLGQEIHFCMGNVRDVILSHPGSAQRDSMATERTKRSDRTRNRTSDLPRTGRMLYQLSYPATSLLRHMTHILLGHNTVVKISAQSDKVKRGSYVAQSGALHEKLVSSWFYKRI